MTNSRLLKSGLLQIFTLVGLILLLPMQLMADTPFPKYHEPEGDGVKCVKPEYEMRRNHMNYILHQRDQTVHDGVRTETYSLAKCIDCHVEPDENGHIAGIETDEHFCNACHQYAAVQIDCFECHADRPQKYIKRNQTAFTHKQKGEATLVAKETAADVPGDHPDE